MVDVSTPILYNTMYNNFTIQHGGGGLVDCRGLPNPGAIRHVNHSTLKNVNRSTVTAYSCKCVGVCVCVCGCLSVRGVCVNVACGGSAPAFIPLRHGSHVTLPLPSSLLPTPFPGSEASRAFPPDQVFERGDSFGRGAMAAKPFFDRSENLRKSLRFH